MITSEVCFPQNKYSKAKTRTSQMYNQYQLFHTLSSYINASFITLLLRESNRRNNQQPFYKHKQRRLLCRGFCFLKPEECLTFLSVSHLGFFLYISLSYYHPTQCVKKTLVRVSKHLGLFFSQFMLEKLANLVPLSFQPKIAQHHPLPHTLSWRLLR